MLNSWLQGGIYSAIMVASFMGSSCIWNTSQYGRTVPGSTSTIYFVGGNCIIQGCSIINSSPGGHVVGASSCKLYFQGVNQLSDETANAFMFNINNNSELSFNSTNTVGIAISAQNVFLIGDQCKVNFMSGADFTKTGAGTITYGIGTTGRGTYWMNDFPLFLSTATVALQDFTDGTAYSAAQLIAETFPFTYTGTERASTLRRGNIPKLSAVATQYLDGTGAWSTPGASTFTYSNLQIGSVPAVTTSTNLVDYDPAGAYIVKANAGGYQVDVRSIVASGNAGTIKMQRTGAQYGLMVIFNESTGTAANRIVLGSPGVAPPTTLVLTSSDTAEFTYDLTSLRWMYTGPRISSWIELNYAPGDWVGAGTYSSGLPGIYIRFATSSCATMDSYIEFAIKGTTVFSGAGAFTLTNANFTSAYRYWTINPNVYAAGTQAQNLDSRNLPLVADARIYMSAISTIVFSGTATGAGAQGYVFSGQIPCVN